MIIDELEVGDYIVITQAFYKRYPGFCIKYNIIIGEEYRITSIITGRSYIGTIPTKSVTIESTFNEIITICLFTSDYLNLTFKKQTYPEEELLDNQQITYI